VVLNVIAAIIIGYLLGSIPFAYITARLKKGIDIRQVGSGNVGALNVYREVGPAFGLAVLAADLVNSLLSIKPIFTLNHSDARTVALPRTTKSAMKHMLKLMEQNAVKGQPLHVAVMHADALDKAIALKNRISSQFECNEIFLTEFTPVMGVHTGPGLIGIAFYSEELAA